MTINHPTGLADMILASARGAAETKTLRATPRGRNTLIRYPVISLVWGVANVVHAVGTWWNHACRCEAGHVLDVSGMLTVTLFAGLYPFMLRSRDDELIAMSVGKRPQGAASTWVTPGHVRAFVVVYAASFAVLVALVKFGISDTVRDILMVSVITVSMAVTIRRMRVGSDANTTGTGAVAGGSEAPRYRTAFLVAALVLLLVGYGCWVVDTHRILCNPEAVVQGHALWHVFTCGTLAFMYALYRTEGYASYGDSMAFEA